MTDFAGVLKELKAHSLLGRLSVLEVRGDNVHVEFGPTAGKKLNDAEEALERAKTEEDIMYGSAG